MAPRRYVVEPMPRYRAVVLDRLIGASRRFPVHALVEFDVEEARARLAASSQACTWTGFVVATIGRAVALHPEVNSRRAGNQVLLFTDVDVGVTVERREGDAVELTVVEVRGADTKSCAQISAELRLAKQHEEAEPSSAVLTTLAHLPGPVRRALIRLGARRPGVASTFGPAVGVTSLGMFSQGGGWAIPIPPLTVIVTVGGVVERPVVRDGTVVVRPMLPLTLSFDHGVVDGAPAARFVETLRLLTETATALTN